MVLVVPVVARVLPSPVAAAMTWWFEHLVRRLEPRLWTSEEIIVGRTLEVRGPTAR